VRDLVNVYVTAELPIRARALVLITPALPALILYLDPVNVAIQLPPFPGGGQVLARFCRELSRDASRLAELLEADGQPSPDQQHETSGDGQSQQDESV
jgi:hypothetical protein